MTIAGELDLDRAVVLAQGGDQRAFGELVTRYKNLVFSVALSVLRDADAACDVTQSVFLTAWQRLCQLRSPSSLPPWLRETARRQALHYLRTKMRERERAASVPPPVGASDADVQLAEQEEARALEVALDEVPAEAREVLMLFYSEDHSVAQVATLLELSEDAVKKRLQRARATLREEYEQALQRRLKRALPGAALVAAILASIQGKAQAAPRPPLLAIAAATVAVVAIAVVAARGTARVAAASNDSSPVRVAATTPRTPSAAGGTPSVAATHLPQRPRDPAPPECSVDSSAIMTRARASAGDRIPADEVPAPQAGEVSQHLEDAMTRSFKYMRAAVSDAGIEERAENEKLDAAYDEDLVALVKRCATSELFDSLEFVLPPSRGDANVVLAAFREEMVKRPMSGRVFGNAAQFADEEAQEQLLERAVALEPDNPRWSTHLGRLHNYRAITAPSEEKVAESQNAIGHFDHALDHAGRPEQRTQLLEESTQAELRAGEDVLAKQHAEELLALATDLHTEVALNARHKGHIVLGQLALRRGSIDEAVRELERSSDIDSSAAPRWFFNDFDLAEQLLERGQRDAVLRYLDRIAPFSSFGTCIPRWKAMVEAGHVPDFSNAFSLSCRKAKRSGD